MMIEYSTLAIIRTMTRGHFDGNQQLAGTAGLTGMRVDREPQMSLSRRRRWGRKPHFTTSFFVRHPAFEGRCRPWAGSLDAMRAHPTLGHAGCFLPPRWQAVIP